MFFIEGTKSLDSNAIEFVDKGINFVGRTFENNGIQGKIEKRDFEPNKPFTITATVIGNYKYVKLQKEPYYCSQNINKLTPKSIFTTWNESVAYFLVANVQKFVSMYNGQQGGYKLEDIKKHTIALPIKDNEIDFDFMESFIAELEAERLTELSAYLKVSGFDNYELSSNEEKALQDFADSKIEYEEYHIGEIFEIKSYKKRFDANKVKIHQEGKFPYVVRMGTNNGQKGYIDEDEQFLNDGNTISFGQDTATMFYQEKPYFTGDKIKVLQPKNNEFNKMNSQYFLTVMSQAFSLFSWGSSKFDVKTIESQKILIPIRNKKIDYKFMETFIAAIQKLVIKDVVLYADKKINVTKDVIGRL